MESYAIQPHHQKTLGAKQLAHTIQTDLIIVQVTKITITSNIPNMSNFKLIYRRNVNFHQE